MPELLVEFYSEEIPARMQLAAAEQLAQRAEKLFKEQGLAAIGIKTYVTPQRLVLVADLPAAIAPRLEEIRGPKTDAPVPAVQGFLGRYGLTDPSVLEKITVGKAEYFQLRQEIAGRSTAEMLLELIDTIRREFNWPKSMRHGNSPDGWVRPLHHIFILFDGHVLSEAKQIFGHRFLSKDSFTPKNFADYQTQLEKRQVLLDHIARRAKIVADANACAAQHGYVLATHDGMLDEVTGLVEYPFIKMAHFEAGYLKLPPELLMAVMHSHQKYLPLRDQKGDLVAAFLFVANIPGSPDDAAIINGNQRVIRARLSDAKFFFEQDLETRLDDLLPKLNEIIFHQKLGTTADKVQRLHPWLEKLLVFVPHADPQKIKRAAELSKADLVSGMVGEFPELQGIMGRNYALVQGEDAEIATAIADHYQPMGPSAAVPNQPVSIVLALADKLDTLVEFFRIGEKPTGSKDPYALRRAALGIIRLVLVNKLTLPLAQLVDNEVLVFLQERLRVQLRDENIAADLIEATPVSDDLLAFATQARVLHDYLQQAEGKAVRAAIKRAFNILRAEEQKDKTQFTGLIEGNLSQSAEQALRAAIQKIPTYENYTSLNLLTNPLDQFFNNTLVNDPDAKLRQQRLQLLASLRDKLKSYADFSVLQG